MEEKRRSLNEIMYDYSVAIPGKEVRKLHKEMKAANLGGFPLFSRYPYFPIVVSGIAFVVFSVVIVVAIWLRFR